MGSCRFVHENDATNIEYPRKRAIVQQKKGNRESLGYENLGGVLSHLLQPSSSLICRPMQSTTHFPPTALILPADGSDVATDGDALVLVVGPNGDEESLNEEHIVPHQW